MGVMMSRFIELHNQEFESSSVATEQWNEFYKVAVKYFKRIFKSITTHVKMSKSHFYFSGFFTTNSGNVYYFSIPDVRWSDGQLLIRRAEDYHDYTGGVNMYITINDNLQESIANKVM